MTDNKKEYSLAAIAELVLGRAPDAEALRRRYADVGEAREVYCTNYSGLEIQLHAAFARLPFDVTDVDPPEPIIAHGAGPAAPQRVRRNRYTKGRVGR